jgi:hypothetical protein
VQLAARRSYNHSDMPGRDFADRAVRSALGRRDPVTRGGEAEERLGDFVGDCPAGNAPLALPRKVGTEKIFD